MSYSIYAFASDLIDEGLDLSLDRILGPGGLTGVTVAATYHASRDVFPHNPKRRVAHLDPGAYFRPEPDRYLGLAPEVSPWCGDQDPMRLIRTATAARGAELHAWVVYLHDPPSGRHRPDLVARNVYGDPMRNDLCPANPEVRDFVVALTADLARYECQSVVAEALHYGTFRHGDHHERCLVELSPIDEFLLGLCFCEHCVARGAASGVDIAGLSRWCRDRLDAVLSECAEPDDREFTRDVVARLADGELGGYLAMREDVIAELVGAAASALEGSDTRFCFQDPGGGVKGYATGEPEGAPAVDVVWRLGIDPARISSLVSEYTVLGYARDPRRLASELAAVRDLIGPDQRLACVLRPAPPDCDGAHALGEKLPILARAEVDHAAFYHYGLLPLRRLDDVHEAVRMTS